MKAELVCLLLLVYHGRGATEPGSRGVLRVTFPGDHDGDGEGDSDMTVIVEDEVQLEAAAGDSEDLAARALVPVSGRRLDAGLDEVIRVKRQFTTKIDARTGKPVKTGCKIEGYQTKEREVCEEIVERICETVENVKYKKEIYTRCDTRLRQECNTTMVEVPREVCEQRSHKECFQDFDFVEDTRFNTECESIVQHVCEEHYKVAVPKPVVFPVPIFTNSGPAPGPYPAPRPYPAPAPYTVLPGPGPGPAVRTKRQLSLSDPGLVSRRVKAATQLPPAPLLSHQELPAPPGCRSVATQKCHKVPEVYAKKVPREECKEVPGVACHLVLEQVETPKCYPVPVEECDDILKEIPYLVEDEECNQVPRLDCNVIVEEIPIQVCTTVDIESATVNFKPGDVAARLTKESEALAKLKEVLNPEDISFLRSKILAERPRVPKSLPENLKYTSPVSDMDKVLIRSSTGDREVSILPKEEIDKLKKKAALSSLSQLSSSSSSSSDKLGKLELLLRGLL